jgi:maleate cis-trans isomerase
MKTYDLATIYDSRASFYGKAKVTVDVEGDLILTSYSTDVAVIKGNKAVVKGLYSQTTTRHIKEFLKQNGFKAIDSKQIEKDYIK